MAEECGERFGDGDRVLTETELHVVVLIDLEVGGAESDEAGDELAVEQQQRSGDPDRRLDVVVVEKRAGLSKACGVIDRRVARSGRRARDVERRDDPGGVCPVQERAVWERSAWWAGQPLVELSLCGLLEGEVVLVQPADQADRDTEFFVVGLVGALAGSAGSELAGVVRSELPSRVGSDVPSVRGGRDHSHCVTITPGPPSPKFHDDRGNHFRADIFASLSGEVAGLSSEQPREDGK
jgi:hypothetical protein